MSNQEVIIPLSKGKFEPSKMLSVLERNEGMEGCIRFKLDGKVIKDNKDFNMDVVTCNLDFKVDKIERKQSKEKTSVVFTDTNETIDTFDDEIIDIKLENDDDLYIQTDSKGTSVITKHEISTEMPKEICVISAIKETEGSKVEYNIQIYCPGNTEWLQNTLVEGLSDDININDLKVL